MRVIRIDARERLTNRKATGRIRNSTSCLQSTRLVRTSDENTAESSVTPAYASSGQKKCGASKRSRLTTSRSSQQTSAIPRRICAAAIENCSAPATPISAVRPAVSSGAARIGSLASRAMASVTASSYLVRLKPDTTQGPDACLEHLIRVNARQAPEIAWFAHALVARTAGQLARVHRFGRVGAAPPRRRARRKGRPVKADDWHPGRRRDVQRTAVAADVKRRPLEQRAQLRQRELAARHDARSRLRVER